AVHIAVGGNHTCAVIQGGTLRCWGAGAFGQLGYGNVDDIGDDEDPAAMGDVDVGGKVVGVAAGSSHTCALLDQYNVRCWGFAKYGELGYANTRNIGDDETPATAGDVNVGEPVQAIAAGDDDTCAILTSGDL